MCMIILKEFEATRADDIKVSQVHLFLSDIYNGGWEKILNNINGIDELLKKNTLNGLMNLIFDKISTTLSYNDRTESEEFEYIVNCIENNKIKLVNYESSSDFANDLVMKIHDFVKIIEEK